VGGGETNEAVANKKNIIILSHKKCENETDGRKSVLDLTLLEGGNWHQDKSDRVTVV